MIKVIYNKVCGRCVQSEPLTSGMVGQPIEFEYSADFDGLTLTAVFTNGKTTVDVLSPGNQCVIPHEVLDTVGTLVKVGIYATRGNELVIPTVYAAVGIVLKGADPSGDTEADPTLPIWAQIQALIGDLADLETEAKNNLVSAINEAAKTGSGSATIEMRVEGGYIQYTVDGKTWSNLIAVADLKGQQGDPGKDGAPGKDGKDGHSPVVTATKSGKTTTISVDGTAIATVEDGTDGAPGVAGAPGKNGTDGHTPVKGTDYWTASDKAEIVAEVAAAVDIPSALPNPNALTFTGAVTGSYDGSAPMTVNIPEGVGGTGGGGGSGWSSEWKVLADTTLPEDVVNVHFDFDSPVQEILIKANIGGNGTNRSITLFGTSKVGYGKNLVTFDDVLRTDTAVSGWLAIYAQAFKNFAFFRCQYNLYNNSVGQNTPIFNASNLRFTDQTNNNFVGESFPCINIGCWEAGKPGVIKAGTRIEILGR